MREPFQVNLANKSFTTDLECFETSNKNLRKQITWKHSLNNRISKSHLGLTTGKSISDENL